MKRNLNFLLLFIFIFGVVGFLILWSVKNNPVKVKDVPSLNQDDLSDKDSFCFDIEESYIKKINNKEKRIVGLVDKIEKDSLVLNVEKFRNLFDDSKFKEAINKFTLDENTVFVKEEQRDAQAIEDELEKLSKCFKIEELSSDDLFLESKIEFDTIQSGQIVFLIINSEQEVEKVTLKPENPFLNVDLNLIEETGEESEI